MVSYTIFASAASTLPLILLLLLLHCHQMHAAGMIMAAVLMQKTLHRVAEADAAKSSDVHRVSVWWRLGSM